MLLLATRMPKHKKARVKGCEALGCDPICMLFYGVTTQVSTGYMTLRKRISSTVPSNYQYDSNTWNLEPR
jgi:hypothetical protein